MKAKTVTTRCWAKASPSAPAPAVAPTAKPRRLSPFGSISLRETARSVVASAGAGTGSRVWEKRKVPRFRGADYEICRWRYFLNVKKVTKERRGFAVGAPARRGRDGNGKIAVRGGEAMAAKRTTAQGGFAQRNAARDFARQTQKVGPVTGQRGFTAGEMRPNGDKRRIFRRRFL